MSKTLLTGALVLTLLSVNAVGQAASPSGEKVAKLIGVLKSDAPQKDKADACRELAVIGTCDTVAPLTALLGDEKLAHMARYALETLPDPAVDEVLRKALGSLKGRPLVGVIGSLGVRKDARAVEPLARFLQDGDQEVAEAAARALGKIGTVEASRALQSVLATIPAARQLAFCEGLLRCAEALTCKGPREEAVAIYDCLRALRCAPHQVRTAALREPFWSGRRRDWSCCANSCATATISCSPPPFALLGKSPASKWSRP